MAKQRKSKPDKLITRSVSYADFDLPQLEGSYRFNTNGQQFTFEQDFIIGGGNADYQQETFESAVREAQAACTRKNGALRVIRGGQAAETLEPLLKTAMRTQGEFLRRDSMKNGDRTMAATLRVTGELPASALYGGENAAGFRFGSIAYKTDFTGRPTYTFTGTYTSEPAVAGGGDLDAIEMLDEDSIGFGAATLIEDWLNEFGVSFAAGDPADSYERIDRSWSTDWDVEHSRQVATFQFVYRYRAIPEIEGGTATDDYVIEQLDCTRTRPPMGFDLAPGDKGAPFSYRVNVSVRVSLDASLDWDDLANEYETKVKPFLAEHLQQTWTGSAAIDGELILQDESVPLRTDANHISVSWVVAIPALGQFIGFTSRVQYVFDNAYVRKKRGDGQHHSYDKMSPGREATAIQTAEIKYFSDSLPSVDAIAALVPYLLPAYPSTGRITALDSGGWDLDREEITEDGQNAYMVDGGIKAITDLSLRRAYTLMAGRGSEITPR